MRRTAVLLSLVAFAFVYGAHELASWGSGHESPFGPRLPLLLPPTFLLIASSLSRHPLAGAALQPTGNVWLVGLWINLLIRSGEGILGLVSYGLLFLGLSVLSLLEACVFPRRPPSPDPERRFTIGLFLVLATAQLAGIALLPLSDPTFGTIDWWHVLHPMGEAAVFLLAAWALGRGLRWGPWVGLAMCALPFLLTPWHYLTLYFRAPEHASFLLLSFGVDDALRLLLLALTAVLLVRQIRKMRAVMAAPEALTESGNAGQGAT